MRIILSAILVFISLNYSLSQQKVKTDSFLIQGSIKGKSYGYIYLNYRISIDDFVFDSALIDKYGRFVFKGQLKYPVWATLRGSRNTKYVSDPEFTEFFIEPGLLKLTVQDKMFKSFVLAGSKSQSEFQVLNMNKAPIEKKRQVYADLIEEYKNNFTKAETEAVKLQIEKKIDSVSLLYKSFEPEIAVVEMNFIKKNPSSFIVPYVLQPYINTLASDSLLNIYYSLEKSVRESLKGIYVFKEINKKAQSYPNSIAPLFSTFTINKEEISLEQYRGNSFVLLDFWASWCIPCRKSFPKLKEIYGHYKDLGFEVISISQDLDTTAWRKAIITDGISNWKHVLIAENLRKTLSGKGNPNDIIEKYFINGIPVQILIDRNGRIVKRWDGEHPQNILELDSILNMELKK